MFQIWQVSKHRQLYIPLYTWQNEGGNGLEFVADCRGEPGNPRKLLCEHQAWKISINPLQWCHNERDAISNYWCLDCLLNRLFRRRSKKTSSSSLVTGGFPHKGPVMRNMFPLDDVIMSTIIFKSSWNKLNITQCCIKQDLWESWDIQIKFWIYSPIYYPCRWAMAIV